MRKFVLFGLLLTGELAGQCTMEGTWSQNTPGVAATVWHITKDGKATETGGGYAEGTATLSGRTLHINWHTNNGYAGYYQWDLTTDCTSGTGNLVFSAGGKGSHASTVRGGGGAGRTLSATLDCQEATIVISALPSLNCHILISGWQRNTAYPVEVILPNAIDTFGNHSNGIQVTVGPGSENIYNWDDPTHSWGIFVFACPSQKGTGANCYGSVTVPGTSPVVPIIVRQKDAVVRFNLTLHATGRGTTGGGNSTSLGCFKDSGAAYDLNGYLTRSQTNTVEGCVQICTAQGFAFAGVQYGQSCLCGNSYGKYGPANNCNMTCTGNSNEVCGGINANNVYPTGAGQKSTVESATNRPGSDYASFWQDQDFWSVCQKACDADARCKAYTYVRAGVQGKQAHCWLKSTAPPAHGDACCVSGKK